MKKIISFVLLLAIGACATAQTTAYTEEGGAVIVINQATGAFVSEHNATQHSAVQCKRSDFGA